MKKLIIVGSGLAALSCIRYLDAETEVILFTKDELETNNSHLAQGGISYSGKESDREHTEDTYAAGDHLGSKEFISKMIDASFPVIEEMIAGGMNFDRDDSGSLALALEGGHHTPRILHAGGDRSGRRISEFLSEQVKDKNVDAHAGEKVIKVLVENNQAVGVVTLDRSDNQHNYFADAVILATGGYSGLYSVNSGASAEMGSGHILAYDAGVKLRQMEMIQFHPTLLGMNGKTCGLVSEAVRGEGGLLVDAGGRRIMEGVHPLRDLAPRHITSYEIFKRMTCAQQTYLDIRPVKDFRNKFPTIYKNVEKHFGKDLNRGRIPVTAGAHFTVGGAVADIDGSTSVNHLYIIGETANTHFHGANRLASNALLEAVVMGAEAAKKINQSEMTDVHKKVRDMPVLPVYAEDDHRTIKEKAMAAVGIIRSAENLEELLHLIDMTHSETVTGAVTNRSFQMYSEIKTIEAIAKSALLRTETRGGHFREDFPGNNINDMDTIVSLKDGKMHAQYIERKRENQTILH